MGAARGLAGPEELRRDAADKKAPARSRRWRPPAAAQEHRAGGRDHGTGTGAIRIVKSATCAHQALMASSSRRGHVSQMAASPRWPSSPAVRTRPRPIEALPSVTGRVSSAHAREGPRPLGWQCGSPGGRPQVSMGASAALRLRLTNLGELSDLRHPAGPPKAGRGRRGPRRGTGRGVQPGWRRTAADAQSAWIRRAGPLAPRGARKGVWAERAVTPAGEPTMWCGPVDQSTWVTLIRSPRSTRKRGRKPCRDLSTTRLPDLRLAASRLQGTMAAPRDYSCAQRSSRGVGGAGLTSERAAMSSGSPTRALA